MEIEIIVNHHVQLVHRYDVKLKLASCEVIKIRATFRCAEQQRILCGRGEAGDVVGRDGETGRAGLCHFVPAVHNELPLMIAGGLTVSNGVEVAVLPVHAVIGRQCRLWLRLCFRFWQRRIINYSASGMLADVQVNVIVAESSLPSMLSSV